MKKIFVIPLLLLTLIACSGPMQPALVVTEIPTARAALTPISSPLPPPPTSESQSAADWNGIPVMPGASAGDGDEEGYVFTIQATSQQVQEYYQLELARRGWQPSAQESSGSSVLLSFTDSTAATLTVSILSNGEEVLVLLVK